MVIESYYLYLGSIKLKWKLMSYIILIDIGWLIEYKLNWNK